MSAFVLSREYELQLPNNYVDVDRDEMEYVDGGGYSAETVRGTSNCLRKMSNLLGKSVTHLGMIRTGILTAGVAGLTIPGAIAAAAQIIVGMIGSVFYTSFLAAAMVYTIKDNGFNYHSYGFWFDIGTSWVTRL